MGWSTGSKIWRPRYGVILHFLLAVPLDKRWRFIRLVFCEVTSVNSAENRFLILSLKYDFICQRDMPAISGTCFDTEVKLIRMYEIFSSLAAFSICGVKKTKIYC